MCARTLEVTIKSAQRRLSESPPLTAVERQPLEGTHPLALRCQRRDTLLMLGRASLRGGEPPPRSLIVSALGEPGRVRIGCWHHTWAIGKTWSPRHIAERRVRAIWQTWRIRRCGGRPTPVGSERLVHRSWERTTRLARRWERRRRRIWLLVRPAFRVGRATTHANSSGAYAAWGLQAEWLTCKRGRVDGRHPNPCLVDFEEVGDEGVEVDI